jgi:hypothetical protein
MLLNGISEGRVRFVAMQGGGVVKRLVDVYGVAGNGGLGSDNDVSREP